MAIGIIALVVVISTLIVFAVIYFGYHGYQNKLENSQKYLTDKELLLMIDAEPDKMITKKQLARKSELTQSESSKRLSYLMMQGVLTASYDKRFNYFYSLKEKIDHREPPQLSEKPFLTVDDVIKLFQHFDYKLTIQKICIASGLPVSVIKREMKYFEKEKVVKTLYKTSADGMSTSSFFVLQEPYRTNPEQFLEDGMRMDLDLEKLYEKEITKEHRK